VNVVFVDDAFQHWSLRPTLHIVTLAQNQNPRKQCLLPAGPLRERVHALRRADMLVITHASDSTDDTFIDKLPWGKPEALFRSATVLGEPHPIGHDKPWHGQPALLVAGLGQSQAVLEQWKVHLNAPKAMTLALPDHASLSGKHWASITQAMQQSQARAWVTSAKDLARLSEEQIARFPLYVIPLRMRFHKSETDIFNQLEKLCANKGQPLPLRS